MIVCIGDLMTDVFLLSSLRAEEQGEGIVIRHGGSAANTGVWLASLGMKVTFVGCAGDDDRGRSIVAALEKRGVDPHVRFVSGMETGAVAVEVTEHGERTMRSARGANQILSPTDVLSVPGPVDLFHLTGYSLLGHAGLSVLEAAASLAREHGAQLAFDPSSGGVIRRFGADALVHHLRAADVRILLPNDIEVGELVPDTRVADAAVTLARIFPTVIVKCGAGGSVFAEGAASGHAPVTPIAPLDTTGAGDAFNAGALATLGSGKSPQMACEVGNDAARHVLHRYGGWPV